MNGLTEIHKTPAAQVRTGHVIAVPEDNYRRRLEVEIVHHETAEVDGEQVPVVRFTGWDDNGRVERGWAHFSDSQVLVVEDRRGDCFQTLIGDTYLL